MGRRSTSSARKPISAEPLINFVHYRLEAILVFGVALFIFYTTCLPTISDRQHAEGESFLRLVLSKQDFAQNIVLYIPLGFFLSLTCRRRRIKWYTVGSITLISAAILSSLAEFAQQFFPGRISSLADVLCNVFGAALGGMCAYFLRVGTRSFRRQLSDQLAHQPIFLSYAWAGAIYVLLSLVPFQLDLTPKTNETILNPIRLTAFTPARAAAVLPQGHTARAQYDHTIDLAVALTGFALIGFLACWSLKEELGFGELTAGLAAMWMIFLLSMLLVLVQMFIHRRGFHIIFVPVSLAGAAVGVLASCTPLTRIARSLPRLAFWTWTAVLFSLVVIAARELSPFEFEFTPATMGRQLARMTWIPFKQYFATGQTSAASGDILAKFGRFFVFGIFLSLALKATNVKLLANRLRIGCWTFLSVAIAIEALQMACPGRYLDITHVLLALGGSLCGMIAMQWWLDLINAYRPQKDDRMHEKHQTRPLWRQVYDA